MTAPLRHYCRNTRCRMKLPELVANEHHAFCTPGCFTSFYRARCRVCEEPIHVAKQRRGPKRILCRKDNCRRAYRRNPSLYNAPEGISSKKPILLENAASNGQPATPLAGHVKINSEVPVKWAFKSGAKSYRGGYWEQYGEERWLLDREEFILARAFQSGLLHRPAQLWDRLRGSEPT
jgi:hypothetical protein